MNNASTVEPATIVAPTTNTPMTTPTDVPGRWRETSDFVARYKFLYDRRLTQPEALPEGVPEEVLARLNGTNLKWKTLNTFAQRALVWDTGYVQVYGNGTNWVKVYTRCGANQTRGLSMASIALRSSDFDDDEKTCSNAAGDLYSRLPSMGLNANTLNCATDVFIPTSVSNSSIWSQDALPSTVVPELTVQLHRGTIAFNAIHASPVQEPPLNICPPKDGALTVPCTAFVPGMKNWCRPAGSKLMLSWLGDLQVLANRTRAPTVSPTPIPAITSDQTTNNNAIVPAPTMSKSTDILVICLGGAFGLAAIFIGVCFMKWFHRKLQSMLDGNYIPVSTPSQRHLPTDRREI